MSNSFIVQVAQQFNTSGGASATAVFPNPLTAGNPIIVSVVAIDAGAAVGSDGPSTSFIAISDMQGNTFHAVGGTANFIYGDATNGISILCGGYLASSFFGVPPPAEVTP
jgi:hypothetical protein